MQVRLGPKTPNLNLKTVSSMNSAFYNYDTIENFGIPVEGDKDYSLFTPAYYNGESNTAYGEATLTMTYNPQNPDLMDDFDLDTIFDELTMSVNRVASYSKTLNAAERIEILDHLNITKGTILQRQFNAITGELEQVSDPSDGGNQLQVMIIEPK